MFLAVVLDLLSKMLLGVAVMSAIQGIPMQATAALAASTFLRLMFNEHISRLAMARMQERR